MRDELGHGLPVVGPVHDVGHEAGGGARGRGDRATATLSVAGDPGVRRQRGEVEPVPACERVLSGQRGVQFVLAQIDAVVPGVGGGGRTGEAHRERDREPAGVELVEESRRFGFAQPDPECRCGGADTVQEPRQQAGDRGGERADRDRAVREVVPRVEVVAGAFDVGEDRVGVGQQRTRTWRQHDAPAVRQVVEAFHHDG